ncbi:Ig-like domain-containing protein, partial [Catenovulum sp. 2E275]|uniref:Ig-like domain-containing protein n=1 Tax=Catenovulum sp. 2E275 TaxID=2980497 RepID=UPI0021D12BED
GVAQNLTALVTGDGSWSVQIPDALPEGEADISVSITDAAGNTVSQNQTVNIDTQAPSLSINAQVNSNDNTPLISGLSEESEGSTVVITVTDANGTSQTITTQVQADSSWSAQVEEALVDGPYNITASMTDTAGNENTVTANGTIDTIAPEIDIDSIGQIIQNQPTFTGSTTAVAGSIITIVITDAAGAEQSLTTTATADGSWSVTTQTPLAEGGLTVTASVTDAAGNTGTANAAGTLNSNGVALNIDELAPTNDTTPNISGHTSAAQESDVIIVVIDSGNNSQTITTQVNADGSWTVEVPDELTEGEYSVTARIESNGVISEANQTGEIDTTAPQLTIDELLPSNDATPSFSGNSDLNKGSQVVVTIIDSEGSSQSLTAIVGENGNWQITVPEALAEGEFSLSVSATDKAGNVAQVNETGEIDLTAPVLTINPIGATNDETPVI